MAYKSLSEQEILNKIQSYCAYQERCESEVILKLNDLGIRGAHTNDFIQNLLENRYFDNQRFADAFVRGKYYIKKWGRIKIIQELRSKKLTEDIISIALTQIDNSDYLHLINALLDEKLKSLKDENIVKRNDKAIKYLLSKGFEANLVIQQLKNITVQTKLMF